MTYRKIMRCTRKNLHVIFFTACIMILLYHKWTSPHGIRTHNLRDGHDLDLGVPLQAFDGEAALQDNQGRGEVAVDAMDKPVDVIPGEPDEGVAANQPEAIKANPDPGEFQGAQPMPDQPAQQLQVDGGEAQQRAVPAGDLQRLEDAQQGVLEAKQQVVEVQQQVQQVQQVELPAENVQQQMLDAQQHVEDAQQQLLNVQQEAQDHIEQNPEGQ